MDTIQLFSYWWNHNDTQSNAMVIHCYGVTKEGKSVLVRINGFVPYIYVEVRGVPTGGWTRSNLQKITHHLKTEYKYIKDILYTRKRKLFYNHNNWDDETQKWTDVTFPYLHITFNKKFYSYKFEKDVTNRKFNWLGDPNTPLTLKVHENNASPILQYVSNHDLPTAGWMRIKGYPVVDNDSRLSICDHEYTCMYNQVCAVRHDDTVPPIRVMSFDIEANSTNPSRMPDSNVEGDKVFQISCCIGMSNDSEPSHNILITLGKVNPALLDESIHVIECANEGDLFVQYRNVVRKYNPQVIAGYNIFNFDIPYMITRSKRTNVNIDFCMQGYTDEIAEEREIKWSSSAYKNQCFKYLDAPGRLYVDMLPIIQRDYKLDNYKLKTVSTMFVGSTKDPLTAKDIFKCYRLGTTVHPPNTREHKIACSAISIVGKYCVQDSALVFKLFSNLQTWLGLVQMAAVVNVPIFVLYTQGQQIKVFSQIYKECIKKGYVVEKDGYVANESDKLMGAIVLDPIPGIYERITPFDFTSLYPTTILAYNLCFSTLVKDDDPIDDRFCHVIQCDEHRSCIAEGMLVNLMYGESLQIQHLSSMYTQSDLKLLAMKDDCEDSIRMIDSAKPDAWIVRHQKPCLTIVLDDHVVLTCTPDHRIYINNTQWVTAESLKVDDHVSCMFAYPECQYAQLITDFEFTVNDADYDMRTEEGVMQSIAMARVMGYLRVSSCMSDEFASEVICPFRLEIDAEHLARDISIACNVRVKYTYIDSSYIVILPLCLHRAYLSEHYDYYIPNFILSGDCPTVLQREFIGALFGSDTTNIPAYEPKRQMFVDIGLKGINSYRSLIRLQNILKEKFGVAARVSFDNVLTVDNSSIRTFYTSVGYRYHAQNQMRVFVISMYVKYCMRMVSMYDEMSWYRRLVSQYWSSLDFDTFVHKRHAHYYFDNNAHKNLILTPVLGSVSSIGSAGTRNVYDLSVPRAHTFTANGVIVHNCEHDTVKRATKEVICQEKTYRFLKEPQGIVPRLLEDLLAARTKTRQQQKDIKKKLAEDKTLSEDERKRLAMLNQILEKRQLSYKVSANSVYGLYGTKKGYLPFLPGAQCTTALGRINIQRAAKYIESNYKATIVYGDSVAGNTPIMVRQPNQSCNVNILEVDKLVLGENWEAYPQFKCGDVGLSHKEYSIPETETEIWTLHGWKRIRRVIRHKTPKNMYRVRTASSCIDVTEDHSLIDADTLAYIRPGDVLDRTRLKHSWPTDLFEFDVFGPPCLSPPVLCDIHEIFVMGFMMALDDRHWVFGDDNASLSVDVFDTTRIFEIEMELSEWVYDYDYDVKTRRLTITNCSDLVTKLKTVQNESHRVPRHIINSSFTTKNAFLDGMKCAYGRPWYRCKTPVMTQGVYFLGRVFNMYNPLSLRVESDCYLITAMAVPNNFTDIVPLGPCDGYVYDIETEDGTFHAGVGELIVKNTDSVYVRFPDKADESYENLWDFCELVEREINNLFIKPMHLSFEEAIYTRFFILTKKRYVCLKSDRHGTISDNLMIRGILLTRRDNADVIRDIYRKTIMSIFYKEDNDKILDTILQHIHGMFTFQHPLKMYMITKSIGDVSDYKIRALPEDVAKRQKRLKELKCTEDTYNDKALPANIQLAEKMRRRGKLVSAGQRIEYVVTQPDQHTARQFDKLEDFDYARDHSDIVRIDPLYYLKLMSKPLDEILKVGINVEQFVLTQYKWRLQYHKVLAQLRGCHQNTYHIVDN